MSYHNKAFSKTYVILSIQIDEGSLCKFRCLRVMDWFLEDYLHATVTVRIYLHYLEIRLLIGVCVVT
jgi:hypothetical protein